MGLLRSVPRLDRPRGSKLETIEGLPPNLAERVRRLPLRAALPVPHRRSATRSRRCIPTDTGGLSRCHRHAEIAAGKIAWARRGAAPAVNDAGQHRTPLLSVRNLTKHFAVSGRLARAKRHGARGRGCQLRSSIPARRSGWSANPAAARPRSAG